MKELALGFIVTTILVVGILFSTAYLSALIESELDSLAAGDKGFAAKDFHKALVNYRKAATDNADKAVAQAWIGYMVLGEDPSHRYVRNPIGTSTGTVLDRP